MLDSKRTTRNLQNLSLGHLTYVICWSIASLVLWTVGFYSRPAAAITIDVTYTEDVAPAYDRDGSRLLAIANAAASFWEDYLHDSFSISINFCYENIPPSDEGDTLGNADSTSDDISIQASPNKPWFFDPTPFDHSEFDFSGTGTAGNNYGGTTLYRDVGAGDQTDWFNGNVPSLLEIGYRGIATGTTVKNSFDIFSTVIHEIGHILGVNYDPESATWNPPASQVVGQSIEIEPDPDSSGHLAARSALMCKGCGGTGVRRLPSAVDILAVAADEGWTAIDLPRQDFIGTGNWNDGTRWLGGAPPDADDYAFIRENATTVLGSNARVEGLLVAESGTVQTGPFNLIVDESTTILGPSSTSLIVTSGGALQTPTLDIEGGTLSLADGALNVGDINNTNLIFGILSRIRGRGTVNLSGLLNNNGLIRADIPGSITINASLTGGASVDLDGSTENGAVILNGGDLVINSLTGLADEFDGEMFIDPGNRFYIQSPWTLGRDGVLTMRGQNLQPSRIAGGSLAVRGAVLVGDSQFAEFQAPHAFYSTAHVTVGENSTFWLSGLTTYRGGTFLGEGLLSQNNDAVVAETTQINTARFDLDGLESKPSTITVSNLQSLVVTSKRIESNDSDGFDGTLNLVGGALDIRTHDLIFINDVPVQRGIAWRMEGTLNLTPVGTNLISPARLQGSRMIVGNPTNPTGQIGRINAADGPSLISAPVTFEESAQVVLSNNARLALESTGPTIYRGGSFTGTGELEQTSDAIIEADTHIQVEHYDMDGSNEDSIITVERLVNFDVDPFQIEDAGGGDGFDGTIVLNGGRIFVRPHRFIQIIGQPPQRQEFAWNMQGRLELNYNNWPATVAGNRMIVNEPDTSQPPATVKVGPGTANVTAPAVTFLSNSLLEIELGGTAYNEIGRLHVLTDLTLDGTLKISLVDGFIPTVGDTFLIADALSDFSGTFNNVIFPGGEWGLTYLPQGVQVRLLADTIDGDFDFDGDVDGNDFLVWQRGGSPNPHSQSDLGVWQANYGATSSLQVTQSVPEPNAAVLLLVAVGSCWIRRGSKSKQIFRSK